jgi:pimeloyl-ACP methyl ester carboxylesterase
MKRVNGRRAIRFAFRAIGLLLLLLLLVSFALLVPQRGPLAPTGDYAVATAQYTLVDEDRIEALSDTGAFRRVNVTCWYPEAGAGALPLVVFSHGAFGLRTSNVSLYTELASHGYLVCSIDHPYHALWTKGLGGRLTLLDMGYMAELGREDAKTDKQQSLAYYQKWMATRMGDLNFVLDTMLAGAADGADSVWGLLDVTRIGVMGHSLGGAAALGIGRQRGDIGAVIALEAPFMYDIIGVENDEFVFIRADYPAPVLNVYSDASWEHLAEWPQYARNHALLVESKASVRNVHIAGIGHLALTDLAISNPWLVWLLDGPKATKDSSEGLRAINAECLAFFDRYLRGQQD